MSSPSHTHRTSVLLLLVAFLLSIPLSMAAQTVSFNPVTSPGFAPSGYGDNKADLNNDGREDLFWTVYNSGSTPNGGTLAVELSNGDGTYGPASYYADPYSQSPQFVTSGDFNRDGWIDIVVAESQSSGFTVFLNNGDGTFRAAGRFTASTNVGSVAAGDFNHDGKIDIAFLQ